MRIYCVYLSFIKKLYIYFKEQFLKSNQETHFNFHFLGSYMSASDEIWINQLIEKTIQFR